ncbi:MAG: MBOAT family O-acyltransferase, partial [Gemmiger sp.]
VRPGLMRYALYVTFLPRVLSGPIGRAAPFFPRLDALLNGERTFTSERARQALTTLLCGYAEKLLLADVLALPVNTVYADLPAYGGAVHIFATALYAFSLYFDFAGYSHIALGAAGLLGVELAPNFRRPFLAGTMAEFWSRWHISLSTWLRDYVYFPLGGSRRGRMRKYANLMVTFLVSGLWHGAAWKYLLWGACNAALQIIGDATRPLRPAHRWMWWRRLCVFAGFVFTLFFFRADSAAAALGICVSVFTDLRPAELINGTLLHLGLSGTELAFALAALAVMLVLSLVAEGSERQGITLYARFRTLAAPLRLAALLALTVLVLLFACRLVGADVSDFYYAAF